MSIIGIVNLKTKDKQMDILNKKFNANIRLGRRSDESLATLLLELKPVYDKISSLLNSCKKEFRDRTGETNERTIYKCSKGTVIVDRASLNPPTVTLARTRKALEEGIIDQAQYDYLVKDPVTPYKDKPVKLSRVA